MLRIVFLDRDTLSPETVLRAPEAPHQLVTHARTAPELALDAIAELGERADLSGLTHIVVASCTGFVAPGIDQIIARRLGLAPSVERLLVGFMGCLSLLCLCRLQGGHLGPALLGELGFSGLRVLALDGVGGQEFTPLLVERRFRRYRIFASLIQS